MRKYKMQEQFGTFLHKLKPEQNFDYHLHYAILLLAFYFVTDDSQCVGERRSYYNRLGVFLAS